MPQANLLADPKFPRYANIPAATGIQSTKLRPEYSLPFLRRRTPSMGQRESAHAAALPIAPAPTKTISPSETASEGSTLRDNPDSRTEKAKSLSRRSSRRKTQRKRFAAARHAAAPAPNGLSELLAGRGPAVATNAFELCEPAKIRGQSPPEGNSVPTAISTVGRKKTRRARSSKWPGRQVR